jgi:3-oxoacyl-[acyl-carrier-protein] synthase II
MESMEAFAAGVIEEGASGANPAVFPNTVYNAAGGQTAIKLGALGVASTVTAQHAAGAQALTYAYDLTSVNQAEVVLAIASDSLTDTVVDAYRDLGLLGGFSITEAGISIVVERAGAAAARGARVYGELAGYGVTSDAEGVGPERVAFARVFGADVAVRTPKVKLGEPLGAGGSLNTVLALLAWQHGVDVGPVVVNSSSLGGTHISLVLVPSEAS